MAVALMLALLIGLLLATLGGGGSILTMPLLTVWLGLGAREAAATSLVVVGVTALVGLWAHARAGRVHWRTGTTYGFAGLGGAAIGGLVGARLPDAVVLGAFVVMMMLTAVAMLRSKEPVAAPAPKRPGLARSAAHGALVGAAAGLVGAGGGFLVVPALALLGGLTIEVAIGTSLLVIAMNAAGGLAGYLTHLDIDWSLAALLSLAGGAGTLAGARFVAHIPRTQLRRAFGWFVMATAALMVIQ